MTADLSQLFEQYYPALVRMLYRRTGDRDRAEDLAQETFARAVSAPPDNPRPSLFAVALNLVREDGRRTVTRGRRLELLRNEQDRPAPDSVAPSSPDRREDELHQRKAGDQRANRGVADLVLCGVTRQQRENDAEPDEIKKDSEEDDRGCGIHHFIIFRGSSGEGGAPRAR